MRLNIVLLLAFQFVVCAVDKATVKTNSDWILFSSKEGRFSVLMPQAPAHTEEKQKTDVGEVTLHIYSSDPGPSFSYVVMYNDFPIGFRKDRSTINVTSNSVNTMLVNSSC